MRCPFCSTERDDNPQCPNCGEGLTLAPDLQLESELGRGGMATVYLGHLGDRQVAIKVLSLAFPNTDWKSLELFERSSQILEHLDHPGLPQSDGFKQDDRGLAYLIREPFYETLEERVRRKGTYSGAALAELTQYLLDLLAYLQGRQPPVVHRDIKPSNIMFRSPTDPQPVLVDFDTLALPSGAGAKLTLVGTPGYAAPEQLIGDASPASDVFGLGATLFFAATQEDPNPNSIRALMPRIDPPFSAVFEEMMAPSLNKRPPNAAAVIEQLRPPSVPAISGRKQRRLVFVALGLVSLLGALTVLFVAYFGPKPMPSPYPDSLNALGEAMNEAFSSETPEDLADLMLTKEDLRAACPDLAASKLTKIESKLKDERAAVHQSFIECSQLIDFKDAQFTELIAGERRKAVPGCPSLQRVYDRYPGLRSRRLCDQRLPALWHRGERHPGQQPQQARAMGVYGGSKMSDQTLSCPFCSQALASRTERCSSCGESLVVAGRFSLGRELGRGGMGAVYEAVDAESGAVYAAKILSLRADEVDWKSVELFERSLRVLEGLKHPSLPTIRSWERRDLALILVREAFNGGTLEERIEKEKRTLGQSQIESLVAGLFDALDFLHSRPEPIIHRDIKPSNIMFRHSESWQPVLVDFDTIAAPVGQGSGLTMVGTPGYAAPEQMIGQTSPASDVYGLGATLVYALTHQEPDKIERRQGKPILEGLLGNTDPALAALIEAMLEPAVEDRIRDIPSARAFLANPPRVPRRQSSRQPPKARSNRLYIVLAVLLLVAGQMIAVYVTMDGPNEPQATDEASTKPSVLQALDVFDGQSSYPQKIVIDEPGARVAVGDFDGELIMWSLEGEPLWQRKFEDTISGLALSADGQWLAVAETDSAYFTGTVHLLEASTGQERWSLGGELAAGSTLQFDEEGQLWLSNYGAFIHAFDLATGKEDPSKRIQAHGESGSSDFVIVKNHLVTGGYDHHLRLFDLSDGEEVQSWSGPSSGFRAVAMSQDQQRVAALEKNGGLWVWQVGRDEALLHQPQAHGERPYDLDFSPDGAHLATSGRDGELKIWDIDSGEILFSDQPHDGKIHCLDWWNAGPMLISGGRDRMLRLWSVEI